MIPQSHPKLRTAYGWKKEKEAVLIEIVNVERSYNFVKNSVQQNVNKFLSIITYNVRCRRKNRVQVHFHASVDQDSASNSCPPGKQNRICALNCSPYLGHGNDVLPAYFALVFFFFYRWLLCLASKPITTPFAFRLGQISSMYFTNPYKKTNDKNEESRVSFASDR